jgi:creatinine amidohydrolase
MGFPGTVSIPQELLVALVEEHLKCLIECGFTHIVLTSSHGGNFGPLAEALPELTKLCDRHNVRLTGVLDLMGWIDALKEAPSTHGLHQADTPAVQADLIETSIMLALHPEMVDMSRAAAGFLGHFEVETFFRDRRLKDLSENGVLGDPTLATAELGAEILASLERYLFRHIEAATSAQTLSRESRLSEREAR